MLGQNARSAAREAFREILAFESSRLLRAFLQFFVKRQTQAVDLMRLFEHFCAALAADTAPCGALLSSFLTPPAACTLGVASIAALAKFSTVLVRPLWREGFGGAGRVATANAIATLTAMMNTPPLKRRCRKAEVCAMFVLYDVAAVSFAANFVICDLVEALLRKERYYMSVATTPKPIRATNKINK